MTESEIEARVRDGIAVGIAQNEQARRLGMIFDVLRLMEPEERKHALGLIVRTFADELAQGEG